MKRNLILAAVFFAALALTVSACEKSKTAIPAATDNSPVLVTVGDRNITVDDFKMEAATLPPYARQLLGDAATRDKFLDELVSKAVLVEAAKKAGFDKDPEVVKRINEIMDNLLLQAYVTKEVFDKVNVTDKDVKDYFEKNRANLGSVRISHIQVGSKEEAEEVLVKYKAGTPFSELAKEYSEDKGTKDKGGDLGYLDWSQIGSSDLRDAAFNTPPGDVSNVIKSSFAYHIIKVTDKKPAKDSDFEKLKDKLKEYLVNKQREEIFNARVAELKKSTKVTRNEGAIKELASDLGMAEPEAAPQAAPEAAPKAAPEAAAKAAPETAPAPAGKSK